MESMYQDYRDIAEFRLVYINEAHASDGRWPVPYAREKGITEHDDYEERCATAEMLISDEELTIPTLIDSMDNVVNEKYQAWPDRIFVVRSDGILAVAAEPGPFGFKPALRQTQRWLAALREKGEELDAPPPDTQTRTLTPHDLSREELEKIAGTWDLTVTTGENESRSRLVVRDVDGALAADLMMDSREMKLERVRFDGHRLTADLPMGIGLEAEIDSGTLTGSIGGEGTATLKGTRTDPASDDE